MPVIIQCYSISCIAKIKMAQVELEFCKREVILGNFTLHPMNMHFCIFPLDICVISLQVPLNFFLSATLNCLIYPYSHHGVDEVNFISFYYIYNHLLPQASFTYVIQTILYQLTEYYITISTFIT